MVPLPPTARPLAVLPLLALAWSLAAPAARAQDVVAPVTSHALVTAARTLDGCPRKHVITSDEGWERVTAGLEQAPPRPDLERYDCLLVVADASHEATSRIDAVVRRGDDLEVTLTRWEPERPTRTSERLECFFWVVPRFPGGVHLRHRTELEEGMGFIEFQAAPAAAEDRDPGSLPRLGADLRLTCRMADGSPVPWEDLVLGIESTFPRGDVPPRRTERLFQPALRLPRIRDGVRHRITVYSQRLRARNPLQISREPARGPGGGPQPIEHCFVLERLE